MYEHFEIFYFLAVDSSETLNQNKGFVEKQIY